VINVRNSANYLKICFQNNYTFQRGTGSILSDNSSPLCQQPADLLLPAFLHMIDICKAHGQFILVVLRAKGFKLSSSKGRVI
jgi:hypothetical protein